MTGFRPGRRAVLSPGLWRPSPRRGHPPWPRSGARAAAHDVYGAHQRPCRGCRRGAGRSGPWAAFARRRRRRGAVETGNPRSLPSNPRLCGVSACFPLLLRATTGCYIRCVCKPQMPPDPVFLASKSRCQTGPAPACTIGSDAPSGSCRPTKCKTCTVCRTGTRRSLACLANK